MTAFASEDRFRAEEFLVYPDESPEATLLRTFAESHARCSACWIDHRDAEREQWLGLQTHHIVKRSRVVCHEHWNLLRLCERCHRLAEMETIRVDGVTLPKLPLAVCLWLKRELAPNLFDLARFRDLYGLGVPEPVRFDPWFERERARREPIPNWRTLCE